MSESSWAFLLALAGMYVVLAAMCIIVCHATRNMKNFLCRKFKKRGDSE